MTTDTTAGGGALAAIHDGRWVWGTLMAEGGLVVTISGQWAGEGVGDLPWPTLGSGNLGFPNPELE